MKVYVDFEGENIISYHSKQSTAPLTEVIQDDPEIDISKLQGYKLVQQDDGLHLVFDQDKYDQSIIDQKKKESTDEAKKLADELILSNVLASATDAQAYSMRYLYPVWSSDSVEYKKDELLMYNDKFYKVLQDHTSQESWTPDAASSLFVEISDPSVEYPEFKQPTGSHDAYQKNDKVTYNGKKYISLIDNNAWSPDAYPAGWRLVESEEA